jgi:sugar lactone lactonase YvrE
VVEELEPRILYSADLAPVVEPDTYATEVEVRTLDSAGEFDNAGAEAVQTPAVEDTSSAQSEAIAATRDEASAAAQGGSSTPEVDHAATPLAFERNVGQTDARVDFLARGSGYGVWLTDGDAVLALDDGNGGGHVLRLDVLGTNADPGAMGEDALGAYTNYLVGDSSSWRTGVDSYGAVRYDDVYAGIDLRYYGNGHRLEYDFIVEAGADAGAIRLAFDGTQAVTIDARGNLVLTLDEAERTLTFEAPVAYQEGALGREAVFSRYVLLDDGSVGFEVGPYDATRELVIDPILAYGTYLGGSGGEQIWNMETDAAGNVYVTGYTNFSDLPTTPGSFSGPRGNQDVFVSKFSPDLSTLLYSTYVGGSSNENGFGIAVDAAGSAYVTGATASADFALAAAYDSTLSNWQDAFVFKLNASGTALVYSTFLGGQGGLDSGYGIAVDAAGNAYVAGYTDSSSEFPLVGALDTNFSNGEAFVTKLNAAGSAVVYSTYFGGAADETIYNIAVDAAGNAVVVGESNSSTLSVALPGAYQAGNGSVGGKYDAFVAKLNASGSGLLYGSFIGGNQDDFGYGVALDAAGRIYLTGDTSSNNFDVTAGAMEQTRVSGVDGFAAVFDPSLTGATSLVYSTYIGGSGTESFWGIDVDASGHVYVAGHTNSANMTVTGDAHQSLSAGGQDIYVVAIDPAGANGADRMYASYLGGSSAENVWGARYANGKFYVAGNAASASGITTAGAYDTGFNGGFDGYVAAFGFETPPVVAVAGSALAYVENAGAVAVDSTLTLSDADSANLLGATVTISSNYDSAQDELAFDDFNPWGITGSWSAVTGTLTLSGVSSVANYQAALRSVTYQNSSENPTTLTRAVTFVASDGTLASTSVARQVAVSPVNDAPLNTVPASQSTTEDTPLVFSAGNGNAITVADADAGGASLQVILNVANGRLTLAQTTNLSFTTGDGSGDASMTFTGTAADINSALNGLRFDPSSDFSGSTAVEISVNDLGNSGGSSQVDNDIVTITVSAVNDAPVQSVPGAQATAQDTALVFSSAGGNAIVIGDTDAGGGELTVDLTATNGTLTLASLTGLSAFGGDGTSAVTLTGTLTALNTALDGLRFTPDAGYTGAASVSVATDDLGNSGSGGNRTDLDAVAITVSANVAPTVTTTLPSLTYNEGDGDVALDPALTVSDVDSPTLSLARLRIQSGYVAGEEKLNFTDQLGITGSWDEASGMLTLNGVASAAAYQSALRTVTYLNSSENPSGARTVSIVVSDGSADSGAATRTLVLEPQNDAPTLAVPGPQSVREDTSLVFSLGTGNQITIADLDAGTDLVRLTLTVDQGTLTLLQTTGLAFVAGADGSASVSIEGSVDDVNAALAVLRFDPNANYTGAASLEIEVDDLGNNGNGGPLSVLRVIDIDVTAVNDAPQGTDGTVTTDEDTAYVFSIADFGFSDPDDAPSGDLLAVRITLLPGGGTLTNNGVPVTAGSFVSAADIGAGLLVFTPLPDANGMPYATLGFQVQDDGGTAGGGADLDTTVRTLTIEVAAVNDEPSVDAPAAQTTVAGTSLVFSAANGNALTVGDIDENGGGLSITLTVADGTLTLATTAGLSGLAGNGSGIVSFSAIPDRIDDALDGLVFTPDSGFFGTTSLDVLVDDLGNTGSPGPLQASTSVTIDVSYVAPVLSTSTGAGSYTEDAPASVVDAGLGLSTGSPGTLIQVSVQIVGNYVDGEDLLDYEVGLLPAGVSANWTAATGLLTFTGSASGAEYEALLRSVTFEATGDAPSTATRTAVFEVDDGTGLASASRDIDVVAVDDAPVISSIADQSIAEGSSTGAVAFTLSDPDTAASTLTVTATASNAVLVPAGAIVLGGAGASRTIDITPAAGESGNSTITIEVFDGSSTSSQSFQLTVVASNQAPVITPASFSIAENSASGSSVGQVVAVDPDVEESFDRIYYADATTNSIVRLAFDGSGVTTLVGGLTTPGGVAVDYLNGKVYWTDSGSDLIQRANLDGSAVETVLSGLADPVALTIDSEGGKLYWIEVGTAAVRRANLDGTGLEDLLGTADGLSDPRALAIDASGDKLYWIDDGSNSVGRANLDGSAVETLVTGLNAPNGVALDLSGGKVYWSDPGTGRIGRANLDGSSVESSFLSVGGGVNGLAVDSARDHVYWTDSTLLDARLRRANLDGTGATTVHVTGLPLLSEPVGIALCPSAPALTYAIVGGNTGSAFAIDSVSGRITVDNPAALDFEATPTFILAVEVEDAAGAVSTQAIAVNLTDVDESPTISVIPNQSIVEDTSTAAISFAIADPETDPDSLVVTAFSSNPLLIPNANIVLGGSGANRTVTVTPAANAYGGPVNITVRVSDGTNNPQRVFAVAITPAADTPSVTNAATDEDTQTASGLVITPNAADGPEVTHFKITGITGGTLYLSDGVTPVVNDQFISVSQGAAGLKFTPAADSTANGSFNVQASTSSSNGGLGGGVATATIAVAAINDVPVAMSDSYATTDGTPFAIAGPGVLANDFDVEGTPLTAVQIDGVSNGVLVFNADGSFSYTPDAGFSGVDSFRYAASDGTAQSAPVVVDIVVSAVNSAPTAITLSGAAVVEGTDTAGGYVVGVLATADPDTADTHTYAIVGGSDAAAFSLSGSNLVLSAGVLDFESQASFEVRLRATDPFTLFVEQTITVAVADVNEAPTISVIADQLVAEGGSLAPLTFTVGDPETAAGALVVTAISSDDLRIPTADLIVSGAGATRSITVTPNPDAYGGPVTITLSVTDGASTTLSSFEITLTAVADHVVTVDTTDDATDGDTSSIDALLMDRGADGFVSLREAILAANNSANAATPERIEFDIAGAGPHSISLLWALPTVTDAVIIDGTTQAGYAGAPIVELNGDAAGAGVHGLVLAGSGSTVRGLVINRFEGSGLVLDGGGDHTLAGNVIGLDLSGALDLGNDGYGIWVRSDGNLIGGAAADDRNIVSGNDIDGVFIDTATDNVVIGNYIGTDATGMAAVGNSEDGIWLSGAYGNRIGGSTAAERNVVSGNLWSGIAASGLSSDNVIQGNYIGVDRTGSGPLGNQRSGISIEDGTGTTIGGAGDAANVIAHNTLDGVAVRSGSGHAMLENAIYANGELGIDLLDDGVTPNDAGDGDGGANQRMNLPVLYSVVVSGGNVTIEGEARPGATVRFYAADGDASGYGEGAVYLGSAIVGGATPGSLDGTALRFSVTFAAGTFGVGDRLTATATDAAGNTSEFARNVVATALAPAILVSPVAGLTTTEDGATATFSVVLQAQPTADVTIALSSTDTTEGLPLVSSLTFTSANWNVAQTVTIAGLPDGLADGATGYTIELAPAVSADLAYHGRDAADVAVVNADGVNDAPTLIALSNSTLSEGVNTTGGYAVGTLSTADPDVFDAHSYSIVGGADAARFSLSGDTLMLDAGVLDYETKQNYVVRVRATDIGGLASEQTFIIGVTNLNDAPVLVVNTGTAVNWGATTVLSGAMLRTTDVDHLPAQVTYRVTGLPSEGVLRLSGAALALNSTFTQADVNNGRLTYTHLGVDVGSDGFAFVVTDAGGASAGPGTFVVDVSNPPIIVPDPMGPPPAVTPDPGASNPTPEPQPEPAPRPSGSDPGGAGAAGPGDAPAPGLGDVADATDAIAGDALVDPVAQLIRAANQSGEGRRGLTRVAYAEALVGRVQTLGGSFGPLSDGAVTGSAFETRGELAGLSVFGLSPRLAPSAQALSLSTFQATLEDVDWVTGLDRMRQDIDAQPAAESALVVSSVAVSGSLSVGYVLWLLRGGLLLSSLLSSLPAWSVIDPMPVLSRSGHDEDDEGDDPLEKLFGRARAALGLKRGKGPQRSDETTEELTQA